MDLLRLPSSLRSSLLSRPVIRQALRTLTVSASHNIETPPAPSSIDNADPPLPSLSESATNTLTTLSSSTLNHYQVALPPTSSQLQQAATFFTSQPPSLLFSSAEFRTLPASPFPEVAFLGRSNVGKSSLLNALFGRTNVKVAHVSKRPGRTRTINGFGVGGPGMVGAKAVGEQKNLNDAAWRRFAMGGLIVVDMPGYGGGSRADWGSAVMKYLERRKQLRRTYVLLDAEHGLKQSDVALLTHLRQQGISHQIVLSKVDKLLYPNARFPSPPRLHRDLLKLRELCENIQGKLDMACGSDRKTLGDIMCCSSEKSLDEKGAHRKIGVNELRWAVLTACGLEKT